MRMKHICKTQDQWSYFRGDLAEEIKKNQDLYESMNTLIPLVTLYLDRIEWCEDVGQAPQSKGMAISDIGDTIATKY